jgi:hypothetical protein
MPFLAFLLLAILFLLSGYGLLQLFGLQLKTAYTLTISLLLGVALASFLPFVLQLCFIPLTGLTVFGSLVLATILLNIPTALAIRKKGFQKFRDQVFQGRLQPSPYEMPFWIIIGFLVFVSVWRCYYLPPTSRDALSGPEAIAEFAFREHTMINSFFNIDLWSTNNQFKSPYLISLQLTFKLAGFPFGQIWLSIVFVSFTIFLYNALKETLHPLLVGILLLIFFLTPEMYAYTFMVLYDYSNMVYLFLGLYFLFKYFSLSSGPPSISPTPNQNSSNQVPVTSDPNQTSSNPRLISPGPGPASSTPGPFTPQPRGYFYFAGLLIGIATYIRSETLALALLFLPPILLMQWREKLPLKKRVQADVLFLLPALLGYILPNEVYNKHYLPVHFDVGGLVNHQLTNLTPLFQRYSDIVTRLLTGTFAIHLWGYIFYLTATLFVAEALIFRRFNQNARNWLYAFVVLYLGIGALGWLLPLFDLTDTTKRALFKILPVALLYLANNELLIRLSRSITVWENAPGRAPVAPGRGADKPAIATGKTVLTKSGKAVAAPSSGGRKTPPGRNRKK